MYMFCIDGAEEHDDEEESYDDLSDSLGDDDCVLLPSFALSQEDIDDDE